MAVIVRTTAARKLADDLGLSTISAQAPKQSCPQGEDVETYKEH